MYRRFYQTTYSLMYCMLLTGGGGTGDYKGWFEGRCRQSGLPIRKGLERLGVLEASRNAVHSPIWTAEMPESRGIWR